MAIFKISYFIDSKTVLMIYIYIKDTLENNYITYKKNTF